MSSNPPEGSLGVAEWGTYFDVAFVCTGNRFRSPLAAALLSARTDDLPVRTSSVGILDLGSTPALPEAVRLARSFGVDLSGHRTRCLSDVNLESLELVLAFEWTHVHAAIVDGHARIDRTFTLPELVGLLERLPRASGPQSVPVVQARARVEAAHSLRPRDFTRRRSPEIPDPLGRPPSEQRRIAEEVRVLVDGLSRMLF
jgi:protein-tyrosine-phosphatase